MTLTKKRRNTQTDPWRTLGLNTSVVAEAVRFDCDLDMEQRIEALALRDGTFWRSYELLLRPEFFGNPQARRFMRLAVGFAEKYGAMPDYTAAKTLVQTASGADLPIPDRPDVLAHVDAVYQTPLIGKAYAEQVLLDMARKMAMRAAVMKITQINESTPDTGAAVDAVAEVMQAALSLAAQDGLRVVDMKRETHLVGRWLNRYTASAVPTMITPLDEALYGGIVPGEVGIVLAPPHRGKSLTLVNFAAAGLVAAKRTLVISNEDGVEGLGPRLYSRLTGMPTRDMAQDPGKAVASLNTLLGMLHGELLMVYMRPRRAGVRDIEALLDRLNAERGFTPELVILDYADRLRPPRKRKDTWDELLDIYMDLSGMAKDRRLAIWTASQTNRAGFSKEIIDMSDFAGAFSKAAEADIVVAFCQTKDEHQKNEARLLVAKARNRGHGKVAHVYVDYPSSRLSEVPAAMIPTLVCNQRKPGKNNNANTNTGSGAARPSVRLPFQQQKQAAAPSLVVQPVTGPVRPQRYGGK